MPPPDVTRPGRSPPAGALFGALLAITLNLLQPLVHAVLMRDAGPDLLWSVWCKAAAADAGASAADRSAPVPSAASGKHDCCLGLAHAPALVGPSDTFVLLPPTHVAALVLLPAAQRPAAAIRDGPPRPRGPPPSSMT